jgi:hypothetical protein
MLCSYLINITLTSSSCNYLVAVCILIRPFRLRGCKLNQTMHQYIERDVYRAAMIILDAQSGLHVSPITALWRSTQLPGICGVIASGSPVAGSYLTQSESDLLRLVSRI